jgi:GMP synthase-like glutamine amidotransferase
MIAYIDLEHERLRANPEQFDKLMARRMRQKYRFEQLSGDLCLVMRYQNANPAVLRQLDVRAVLVSGAATDFEHYSAESLAGLYAIYREATCPVLGLCAGHQLLAQAYGGPLAAMGPLPPGAPDPYAGSEHPAGQKQERGYMPVRVTAEKGLLDGLGKAPILFESHYWEVKSLPPGFRVLAESDLCPIQAIAHESLPLFGTQFHPEEYDDEHPMGRRVLGNFFRLAGVTG